MNKNDERPMRIAYLVANIEDISGGTRVIIEHVNHLLERGHTVELWTTEGAKPYFDCKVPVRVAEDDWLSEPDILVMTDPGLLPRVSAHRTAGKTFLLMQHDNEWVSEIMNAVTSAGLLHEYQDYFLDGRYGLLAVSMWVQEMVKLRYGIDGVLVPNGANTDLFHPTKSLMALDDPSVLLVYDPQVWKGFSDAIEAVLEVQKKVPNLHLMILGRYFPEQPNIPGIYTGFAFPAIFFNRPAQKDLASIYASATVFVSSSWREGFGLPGLEALACGTPLVSTDSGGIREYAIPDETAVIIQPNRPAALAEGILRVINDTVLQERLAKNGLKKAKEFSWDTSMNKLEEIFKKAILQV